MSKLVGKFRRRENGRLSYEILMPYDDIFFKIVSSVAGKFYFSYYFEFLAHQCYAVLDREDARITIGWHESCGIYVEADSKERDPLVREIGHYLNDTLDELEQHRTSN